MGFRLSICDLLIECFDIVRVLQSINSTLSTKDTVTTFTNS